MPTSIFASAIERNEVNKHLKCFLKLLGLVVAIPVCVTTAILAVAIVGPFFVLTILASMTGCVDPYNTPILDASLILAFHLGTLTPTSKRKEFSMANFHPIKERRVVCAACKVHVADGIIMLIGARHLDGWMRTTFVQMGYSHDQIVEDEQGFIDQRGVFMDRQVAWSVAEAARQILYRVGGDEAQGGTLYSENLY
jgi:hypothetical protein